MNLFILLCYFIICVHMFSARICLLEHFNLDKIQKTRSLSEQDFIIQNTHYSQDTSTLIVEFKDVEKLQFQVLAELYGEVKIKISFYHQGERLSQQPLMDQVYVPLNSLMISEIKANLQIILEYSIQIQDRECHNFQVPEKIGLWDVYNMLFKSNFTNFFPTQKPIIEGSRKNIIVNAMITSNQIECNLDKMRQTFFNSLLNPQISGHTFKFLITGLKSSGMSSTVQSFYQFLGGQWKSSNVADYLVQSKLKVKQYQELRNDVRIEFYDFPGFVEQNNQEFLPFQEFKNIDFADICQRITPQMAKTFPNFQYYRDNIYKQHDILQNSKCIFMIAVDASQFKSDSGGIFLDILNQAKSESENIETVILLTQMDLISVNDWKKEPSILYSGQLFNNIISQIDDRIQNPTIIPIVNLQSVKEGEKEQYPEKLKCKILSDFWNLLQIPEYSYQHNDL